MIVAPPDEQPVLLLAVEVRRYEGPNALETLAVETDGQLAVPLLLHELVGAVIPDLDRPGSVLPSRNLAGEGRVLERVILDMHGERPRTGLERHALRHRP
jgi:hypothetical protein